MNDTAAAIISNARVYIAQEPQRWDPALGISTPTMDFTPALRYGELVTCLPPGLSFQMIGPITTALKERMRDFRETDYLIAVGSPLAIVLSSAIALRRTGGKLNLLSWDKRERQYINTRIEL